MKTVTTNGSFLIVKGALILSFALLIAQLANAQEIIWASKVLKYTSETGPKAYSANQVLGKPNSTPDSLGNSWQPNSQGKPEIIEVSFASAFKANQVFIIESKNPGFIRNVVVKNTDGIEFPVASYMAKSGVKGPRLLSVNIADYYIDVASVIITMIPVRNVPVSIDAIGLTDSSKPFRLINNTVVEPIIQ